MFPICYIISPSSSPRLFVSFFVPRFQLVSSYFTSTSRSSPFPLTLLFSFIYHFASGLPWFCSDTQSFLSLFLPLSIASSFELHWRIRFYTDSITLFVFWEDIFLFFFLLLFVRSPIISVPLSPSNCWFLNSLLLPRT